MIVKQNISCDLLILDEIHGYTGGEIFQTVFDCVNYKYILGLTAQERDKAEDKALLKNKAPVVDIITLKEALENGWVSPFKSYNLPVELNEADKKAYEKLNKDFHKYFSTFGHDFNEAMACLGNKKLREKVALEMGMEQKIVDAHTFMFNKVMQDRKNFIYNCSAIQDKAVEIIDAFPDKKILTFSQTTDAVDRLTMRIENSLPYHTNVPTIVVNKSNKKIATGIKVDKKTKYKSDKGVFTWQELKKAFKTSKLTRVSGKKVKEQNLKDFTDNKVRILHSATALNEGKDVPDIDMSIKTAFTSTAIDAIQRLGRTLRLKKNKVAIEVNLYIPNTQSEKWLKKSQEGIPNVEWITSINEINTQTEIKD